MRPNGRQDLIEHSFNNIFCFDGNFSMIEIADSVQSSDHRSIFMVCLRCFFLLFDYSELPIISQKSHVQCAGQYNIIIHNRYLPIAGITKLSHSVSVRPEYQSLSLV